VISRSGVGIYTNCYTLTFTFTYLYFPGEVVDFQECLAALYRCVAIVSCSTGRYLYNVAWILCIPHDAISTNCIVVFQSVILPLAWLADLHVISTILWPFCVTFGFEKLLQARIVTCVRMYNCFLLCRGYRTYIIPSYLWPCFILVTANSIQYDDTHKWWIGWVCSEAWFHGNIRKNHLIVLRFSYNHNRQKYGCGIGWYHVLTVFARWRHSAARHSGGWRLASKPDWL